MIIIIIIALLIFLLNYKTVEGYDVMYKNSSFENCAKRCKETEKCFGFGHKENKCYLSQDTIVGYPTNTVYRDSYKPDNARCNKVEPITIARKVIPFSERRDNSIFVCSVTGKSFPQQYLHSDGQFELLGEGRTIPEIVDVDQYSVKPFKWPNRYQNNNELLVLDDGLDIAGVNVHNIEDLNAVVSDNIPPEKIKTSRGDPNYLSNIFNKLLDR